jgi:hypothetical protein
LSSRCADDLPTQPGFSGGTAHVLVMITDVEREQFWVLVHDCSFGLVAVRPMVLVDGGESRGPRHGASEQ